MIALRERVDRDGFAFVAADDIRLQLDDCGALSDWPRFAASWNDLQLDIYLPDGHRYRRRRHATLSARAGEDKVTLEPRQPHYQTLDYNPLVGGIERWFEPMHVEIVSGPTMQCVLAFSCGLFGGLRPNTNSEDRVPSVSHRGALRRARTADTRGRASRRRGLCAGASDQAREHQKRHDYRA